MLAEVLGCCQGLSELKIFFRVPNNIYFDLKKVLGEAIALYTSPKSGKVGKSTTGSEKKVALVHCACQGVAEQGLRSNLAFFALFCLPIINSKWDWRQTTIEPPTAAMTKTFVGTGATPGTGSLVRLEAWTGQEALHRNVWTLKEVQLRQKQKRKML